jgi:hypothetical protein
MNKLIYIYLISFLTTSIQSNTNEISMLIGKAFIERKAAIAQENEKKWELPLKAFLFFPLVLWMNYTSKKKEQYKRSIFETTTISIHGISFTAKKETIEGKKHVIIETELQTNTESFTGKKMLTHEEKLLKGILLSTYLEKKNLMNNDQVPIDNQTHSTLPPQHYYFEPPTVGSHRSYFLNGPYQEEKEEDPDTMGMKFKTTFTQEEFAELIDKYFKIDYRWTF